MFKMAEAYIFDLFGTLAYGEMALKNDYHEHLLVTKLADSKLSEEEKEECLKLLERENLQLYEDSEQVIKKLKEKGYNVAVLSNIYEFTANKVRKKFNGFLELFDYIALSCEIGIAKPNPKIFLLTLDKLGAKPEEAVMVGDSIKRDIIPARQLNMDTILIDRKFQRLENLI